MIVTYNNLIDFQNRVTFQSFSFCFKNINDREKKQTRWLK